MCVTAQQGLQREPRRLSIKKRLREGPPPVRAETRLYLRYFTEWRGLALRGERERQRSREPAKWGPTLR